MRPAMLTGIVFVAFTYAASAQKFSLLPQLGLENTRTTLKYNNLSCFSPLGSVIAPKLGARLEYQSKKLHGAFAGIATNRSVVSLRSSDPGSGLQSFKSSASNLRPQLEAGYQVSTKPIYFNKSRSNTKSRTLISKSTKINEYKYTSKRCGASSVKSHCGKSSSISKSAAKSSKNKGWFMSIKPSVGAAFVPGIKADVITSTEGSKTFYTFNAGNWNTALIAGAAFEFGSHNQKNFTVSVNHLRGVGNLGRKTMTTASEGKTMVTHFNSSVSNWNITAGIPINLSKKKTPQVRQKAEPKTHNYENKCWQYRMKKVI
ncbi:MAG: hypothetical protein WKF97_03635 [Chitinophagaceae bacterium]